MRRHLDVASTAFVKPASPRCPHPAPEGGKSAEAPIVAKTTARGASPIARRGSSGVGAVRHRVRAPLSAAQKGRRFDVNRRALKWHRFETVHPRAARGPRHVETGLATFTRGGGSVSREM